MVLLIDEHASTVSLALIGIGLIAPLVKKLIARFRGRHRDIPREQAAATSTEPS